MPPHIKTPIPKRPFVDYLRFVLPWAANPGDNHQLMFERARRRIQAEIENGTCKGTFANRGRYRFVFSIPLSGEFAATVWIGARDPARQKGGISVSLNPSKLEPGDMEHFHEVMERIVGPAYKRVLRGALINRIDFAVDIVDARLDRLLVSYQYAQQFTVFGKTVKKGVVETYNFGSEKSPYMTTVYDKNIERRHRAIEAIAKHGLRNEPLKAYFIKQLDQLHGAPPLVRVEVRGMQLKGLSLSDLHKMANRFARFTFADLNGTGKPLPKKLLDAFMSLCRDRGVKAALDHYKGTPDVQKVNAFWRSRCAKWWKPERMMEQACDALRCSGIFPTEAFGARDGDNGERNVSASRPGKLHVSTLTHSTTGAKLRRIAPDLLNLGVKRTTIASTAPMRGRVRRVG
ncbi:hypothetical protein ACVCIC_18410 [Burkholderia glumae]|uniref:Replication-associated protein G2P N-terminal domain-containing protein n=1 Tax=Burkholderia glumae TaxID=337 RepID=A0ABY5BL65_BURGL|nr:hypothetical protein [Burkholderia glumae]USS47215.1 hypothetical protein NFI99_20320 [Burkholderia glumae]